MVLGTVSIVIVIDYVNEELAILFRFAERDAIDAF